MSGFRTTGAMQLAAVHYRNPANVLADAAIGRFRNAASALKTFFSAFSASITPEGGVVGYGNSGGAPDISTSGAICNVDGGVAPITYLWTRTDGGGDAWTIDNPAASITSFTATAVSGSASAEFICTATDDIGAIAVAGPIPVSALNLGGTL